jgi:hypothetical protein
MIKKINSMLVVWTLLAGACCGFSSATAEEVVIVFSGQANAAIYPCHCPKDPEGGVARRGAAIKKLREAHANLIVVEAGSSFGSGPADSYAQNLPLDMRRTEVYLAAQSAMRPDALLVSGQEFIFGVDFLNRYKDLPFVSSNCEGVGVPMVLRKLGSVTVGILGVTDPMARTRGASAWRAPQQALASSIKTLKEKGANLIVLISALRPEEDKAILKDVKGIDVVVNGSIFYGSVAPDEESGVVMVKTWWQAKKLGVLALEVNGKKVKIKSLKAVSLGPDVGDDPDVVRVLPVCFQDNDCAEKVGMGPRCENAGQPNAQCQYTDLAPVPVTVIVPRACRTCRVDAVLSDLEKMLGRVKPVTFSEDAPEAKALIKDLRLKMLPAFIFDATIEAIESYPYLSKIVDKVGRSYVIKPEVAGVSYFIDRKPASKQLDVFFDFTYPTLGALCDRLKEFQEKHREVAVRFHFLAAWDEKSGFLLRPGSGEQDVDEFRRAACVYASAPQKFLEYIGCRSSKRNLSSWEMCATQVGIDPGKIGSCFDSVDAEKLLKERIRLTKELEMATGPIFLIDNKEVFGVAAVPSLEEFEKIVLGDEKAKEKEVLDSP